MNDFTAKSCNHEGNHEGHKGTQRKCASFLFTFVRFVSFVVKPFCSGLMNGTDNENQRMHSHSDVLPG